MNREEMTEKIIEDLPQFQDRDEQGFWDHVNDMERTYLGYLSDKEIEKLYEEIS